MTRTLKTFAKLTARRSFLLLPAVSSLFTGSMQARELAVVALVVAAIVFAVESVVRSLR